MSEIYNTAFHLFKLNISESLKDIFWHHVRTYQVRYAVITAIKENQANSDCLGDTHYQFTRN